MSNITELSKYNIVGTLKESPDISVYIASEEKGNAEELFIINKFPKNKSNDNLFKEIFSYYSSPQKSKDMDNFFASKEYFCVVFKYGNGEKIKNVFSKEKSSLGYDSRSQVLYNILLKIENISNMPLILLLNATLVQNICVDNSNNLQLIYNLSYIKDVENLNKKHLFKNIYEIINIMLENEISKKNNSKLQIIMDKCKNQIYTSIPELIIDLKKSEQNVEQTSIKAKIKMFVKKHKKAITIVSLIGCIALLVVGGINLYNYLFKSDNYTDTKAPASIGDIIYSAGTTSGTDNVIDNGDSEDSSNEFVEMDLTISPTADINYEDYIVQQDDTVKSICESHYNNPNFIRAILSFNSLEEESTLMPGSIIKLPNKDAVLSLVSQ